MNTSLYPPNCGKDHVGAQTEMRRQLVTPQKKAAKTQTVKAKDAYKDDWEKSQVYRKALKVEAEKRGIPFVDPVSDEEEYGDDSSTQGTIV